MKSMNAAGEGDAVAFLMRKDKHVSVRVEELEAPAETLAVLYTEGMNLFGALKMANLYLKARRPHTH